MRFVEKENIVSAVCKKAFYIDTSVKKVVVIAYYNIRTLSIAKSELIRAN